MKAKRRIPPLRTEEATDRFWSEHSLADYLGDTEAVDEVLELAPDLARKIRERSRKRLLTIRIEGWMVDRAKKIAREKRIPYQRLLRDWIGQGMRDELRTGRKRLKA